MEPEKMESLRNRDAEDAFAFLRSTIQQHTPAKMPPMPMPVPIPHVPKAPDLGVTSFSVQILDKETVVTVTTRDGSAFLSYGPMTLEEIIERLPHAIANVHAEIGKEDKPYWEIK